MLKRAIEDPGVEQEDFKKSKPLPKLKKADTLTTKTECSSTENGQDLPKPKCPKLASESSGKSEVMAGDSTADPPVSADPAVVDPAGEREYFESYAHLDIHRVMIEDAARTQAYRRAILTSYPLFRGKTVLDVGCGTGILSVFCCHAGARRVYAVEASAAAEFARRVAEENGYADRITVLNCRVEEAEIPEQVDVIVSEWMGHALLYESMLESVLRARDRWLRPGGALFPEHAALKVALCSAPDPAADDVRFWRAVHDTYKVRMASLAVPAAAAAASVARVYPVLPEEVHSHAATLAALDLRSLPVSAAAAVQSSDLSLVSFGRAELTGLVLWFDVRFPGGEMLSTSPYAAETHWLQTVLPLSARPVDQDTRVAGRVGMSQNPSRPRYWQISAQLRVGEEGETTYRWDMDGTS